MATDNKQGQQDQGAPAATEGRLIATRRAKLAEWRELQPAGGEGAYPNDFRPVDSADELMRLYPAESFDKVRLKTVARQVSIAGRVMLRRTLGKAGFMTLQDAEGQIQCYIRQDAVTPEQHQLFAKFLDIGDVIGVRGELMRTNAGELTVAVSELRLLAKALRPLPEKHAGLKDTELKYRQRYLDLLTNKETRDRFRLRSEIIAQVRAFLLERNFLEVETPIMQPIASGAAARPFVTHHNALDRDLYLRVAPELYLKRLVVGGFERIFEMNRNFRNEGLSARHNPEFTMLELYQTYVDYTDMMAFTEELLCALSYKINGKTRIQYQGQDIDFNDIPRLSLQQALGKYGGYGASLLRDPGKLTDLLKSLDVTVQPGWGIGKLQLELFEAKVEPVLVQPVFITGYPAEVSPLARRNATNPELTDRFELFVASCELANGFSELNDPEDQTMRLRQQHAGQVTDEDHMRYDSDYITALEYGMPPTAGVGIGIDRVVMLLVDAASIRDVLLFPQMRQP